MAPAQQQPPSLEAFDAYFRRADLDRDGRISGVEAVAFFQGSGLPKPVLAQIWMYADHNRTGYLGRQEFHNYLRLVTVAQSGRELTPDIVKAALYSPAAARIPAPQINPVSSAASQLNSPTSQSNTMMSPLSQTGVMGSNASQNLGFRSPQAPSNAGSNHFMRPPQATITAPRPTQGINQGLSGGNGVAGPGVPSSNAASLSTDWLGRPNVASEGVTSQISVRGFTPSANQDGFGLGQLGTAPGVTPRPQTPSVPASTVPSEPLSLQPTATDSKALGLSGNGFSSGSFFGGDAFSTASQAKQDASKSTFSVSTMPNISSNATMSAGSQNSTKPGQHASWSTPVHSPTVTQLQTTEYLIKQNRLDTTQSTSALTESNISVRPPTPTSSQSQFPWPRITQSDIQKYTGVFVDVDKDRDGKITGPEARNLFLSWGLPREVLKQVWDLSDQDNDSMLSLREFCTALYLMARFREGRPLPAVLPDSLRFDETMIHTTSQPAPAYTDPAWKQHPGLPQQRMPGSQHVMPPTGTNPPMQAPLPSRTDGTVKSVQQKSKVPVLEKHLTNQLSKEEQSGLNSKFQEASAADKKVQELEKDILDSREKIEYYRTKMQEIVLYKSKCDSRLNEIIERTSADRREVEILAKKYEAKYKESGDVASRLTLDEATFRDIQDTKLELFNTLVKMEKGGDGDDSLQARANRLQSDLDELVKTLNERCKQYGLRAKPTTLVELPFGWQRGIQEDAAGWDEDWDKLEEDGFTIIKELTIEEETVVPSEKPKLPSVDSDIATKDEESSAPSSSDVDSKIEKPSIDSSSSVVDRKIDAIETSSSVTDSRTGKPSSAGEEIETESHGHNEGKSARSHPGSPERSALESKSPTHHAAHDVSLNAEESHSDHVGTESSIFGKKPADEPSWGATFESNDDVDSIWGFNTLNGKENDQEMRDENYFFGSEDFGLNPVKTGSPSAVSMSGKEKKGPVFDSVPSTPLFNSTSPRFSEGPEDHTYDSFSQFDSFSMHDGIFPQHDSFGRFDSMRGEKFARFDSISSTTDHDRGFPSFDDPDPFGSSGPFKSLESRTPKKDTDHWSAF